MVETFRIDAGATGHVWPALVVLRAACADAGVEFFVVGAAARDLLLEHVYGSPPLRATRDVDAAVAVRGWTEYDAVIARLVGGHGFTRGPEPHRVRRPDLVVDVVPFGEIARPDGLVEWPGGTTTMSTLGYEEAYRAAVGVVGDDGPAVRVASLPGLGVLKLVAWGENSHRRGQDPVDLCAVMRAYDGVVGDRLYTEHGDLFDEADFDLRVASARAYGRDVGPLLVAPDLRERVVSVLDRNTRDDEDSPLAVAMGAECAGDIATRLRILQGFAQGVRERLPGVKRDGSYTSSLGS